MQRPSQPITGASCQRPHTSAKGALRANGHRQLFFIQFSLFFFAGVSLYSLGIHHLSARAQLAAGALVLVVASLALLLGRPLLALWLTVPTLTLLFGIAATPGLRSAGRFGDVSYGIYIYAFSVQQTFIWLYKDSLGFWQLLAASAAVTVVLAFLSWHLVENRPCGSSPGAGASRPRLLKLAAITRSIRRL